MKLLSFWKCFLQCLDIPLKFLEALTQDRFSCTRELAVLVRHGGAEDSSSTLQIASTQEKEGGAEPSVLHIVFPHSTRHIRSLLVVTRESLSGG